MGWDGNIKSPLFFFFNFKIKYICVVGDNESLGCRGSVVGQDTAARYYRGRPAAALKKLIRFAARYYRERPAAALKKLIKFYVSMGHLASLRAKYREVVNLCRYCGIKNTSWKLLLSK